MKRRQTFLYVKNRRNLYLICFLLMMIMAIMILLSAELKLRPLVKDMALSRAKLIATKTINEAIQEEMDEHGVQYDDVVFFEKDNNNNIIAVKMDIVKINKLKASVVASVSQKLSNIEEMNIQVPLGNIINGEIFSGRGPKINIKLVPVGSVNSVFVSEFTSAGINQTRHRILAKTSVYISVLLPVGSAGTEVISEINVAETLIIGNVPESYTNIEDNESEILEKLNDYGD